MAKQTELLDLTIKENADFMEDLTKTCLMKTWQIVCREGTYTFDGSYYQAEKWAKEHKKSYTSIR